MEQLEVFDLVGHAIDKNGAQDVVLVLKNHSFSCGLRSTGTSSLLSRATVTAELVYDTGASGAVRPVSFVAKRPLEFFYSGSSGSSATSRLDLRVMVLSSQHENAAFRIRFTAIDTAAMTSVSALSPPLRCVSKISSDTAGKRRLPSHKASPSSPPTKKPSPPTALSPLSSEDEAERSVVTVAPSPPSAVPAPAAAAAAAVVVDEAVVVMDEAVGRALDHFAEAMRAAGEDAALALRRAVESRLTADPLRFAELSQGALALHSAVFPLYSLDTTSSSATLPVHLQQKTEVDETDQQTVATHAFSSSTIDCFPYGVPLEGPLSSW